MSEQPKTAPEPKFCPDCGHPLIQSYTVMEAYNEHEDDDTDAPFVFVEFYDSDFCKACEDDTGGMGTIVRFTITPENVEQIIKAANGERY